MSGWSSTLRIAAWEFRRLFKWRDQLMSLAFFAVLGVGWLGVNALIELGGNEQVDLAAVGLDAWGDLGEAPDGIAIEHLDGAAAEVDEARRQVLDGEIDGLLFVNGMDGAEVFVDREPAWRARLQEWLDREARRARIEGADLTEADVDALLAPVGLELQFADNDDAEARRAVRPALVLFIVFMVMGLFTGNAYLFTGITGEKQQRMTEQILAILPPQRWIDGKVVGIVGMVAVSLAFTFVSIVVVNAGLNALGTGVALRLTATSATLLTCFAIFSGFGFLLWFGLFGAIAATINDPNTSSRGSMMFLPVLPAVFVLGVIKNPDSWVTWGTSLFPLTSSYVMPTRLVFSEVPTWELAVSIGLLVATVLLVRKIAGRIFEFGILIHGKEPTWSEMARAARRGGSR